MPILAVGTANPGKVESVKRALAFYPALADFTITPAKVGHKIMSDTKDESGNCDFNFHDVDAGA